MPYNVVSLGGETRIHTSTGGVQAAPQFIRLPDGRFILQWVGNGTVFGQEDPTGYFQQLFDANGVKIGSEVRVNAMTDGEVKPDFVSVALPGVGWGSIWKSVSDDPAVGGNAYFRTFDMNGTPGQQLRINETENGISEDWRNVFLRNANSIVLWNGKGTQEDQTDDAGIFFRLMDEDGDFIGGETRVNVAVEGREETLTGVTALSNGGFVVTYRAGSQAFQQAFDRNGAKVGEEFHPHLQREHHAIRPQPGGRQMGDLLRIFPSPPKSGTSTIKSSTPMAQPTARQKPSIQPSTEIRSEQPP